MRLVEEMHDAKEYGSIIHVTPCDWDLLRRFAVLRDEDGQLHLDIYGEVEVSERMLKLINIGEALAQKYHVVVTNPPYMGNAGMGSKLSAFVKKNYDESKTDMFSVFIERCGTFTANSGYYAMITQPSLLFLKAFSKLRRKIINNNTISSLLHMGRGIFGIDFGSTSFVFRKRNITDYKGVFFKLHERTFQYIEPDDIAKLFLLSKGKLDAYFDFSTYDTQNEDVSLSNLSGTRIYYENKQSNFLKLPESPFAYWMSQKVVNTFSECKTVGEICAVKNGMSTTDNNRFLRQWYECEMSHIGIGFPNAAEAQKSGKKWFPYNKGGDFRKYYGNIGLVVNWKNDGQEIKKAAEGASGGRIVSQEYYFKRSLSWSKISAGQFALRMFPEGFLFDVGGPSIFADKDIQLYVLGFFSSKVKRKLLEDLAPTINYEMGQVSSTPLVIDDKCSAIIETLVNDNVIKSKIDWDSFETSWDFVSHPLVRPVATLKEAYTQWEQECDDRFNKVKENEEKLNHIFIDIYGLQDELSPEVEDKDVTIRKADLQRDIHSLLSYAVGCMFGRYSLDVPGLIYAGGEWDSYKYATFQPDKDAIIPICDDEYFEDDILGRFVKFIEVVFGRETLEENLRFIADALGGKGSSREVIRNYFINDFYADHLKMYQKRPIYWLFDSGKKNGFKCLIYMHRYQPDTIARIRTDYVHEQQSRYRTAISDLEQRINGASTSERVKLSKQLATLQTQADEIRVYEEKIHHLADQMIKIDLDDGVKHNYEIFKDVLAKIK